jgi:hypothetical protein
MRELYDVLVFLSTLNRMKKLNTYKDRFMSLTFVEPIAVNTSANFTFADSYVSNTITAGNIRTNNIYYANGQPYSFSSNAGGSNTQIQFNDSNSFAGSANLTFNKTTNTLSVTNITSSGVINFSSASNVTLGAISNVRITGGSSGQYLTTDGSGTLSWATISSSSISNGTSNVSIATTNGNVTVGVGGTSGVLTISSTSVNVAGILNTGTGNLLSGNANLGNLAIANFFSGNGSSLTSITGANVLGTVGSATNASALLQNTSTSTTVYPTFTTSSANGNSSAVFNTSISANLGNASITATTFVGTLSGAATTAGTVTTAAQPNITSVGTLTGLTSTGTVNLTGASNVSLGPVANVRITGGANGQVLSTDGSGNLNWITSSGSGGITTGKAIAMALIFG